MCTVGVDRRIWPLILPFLSLCDLDCISKTCSKLKELVGNHTNQHGVHIEECCLRTRSRSEIYKKYGQSVSILTLDSLPACEAYNLIGHFSRLSSLTLINMTILEGKEIAAFPLKLTALFLIDCKIERDLFRWWMPQLNDTLIKLHLRNFQNNLSLSVPAKYREVHLGPLKNLESLTIEGNALRIYVNGRQLKYLKIRSTALADVHIYRGSGEHLRELHFDVHTDQWDKLKIDKYHDSLQRLTTRTLLPLKELQLLKCLNQMEILLPVDVLHKEAIEALNISNVKVDYVYPSPPPEETNLILKKLNEDCLLKIIRHLKVSDWMSFGQVHPKIERILTEHKYPRAVIRDKDIEESGISGDLSHIQHIAKFIAQYNCLMKLKYIPIFQHHLTALHSLTLYLVSFKDISIEVLPDRLKKLVLQNCRYEDNDLGPYFQRLSSTLRVLELTGCNYAFRVHWLEPLRNMRELIMQSYDFTADLSLFLDRNAMSLERFQIDVHNIWSWSALQDVLDRISSMKNLKCIGIQQVEGPPAGNSQLLAEVLKNIGPQLKTLAVNFGGTEMEQVLKNECLRNLQELEIEVGENTQEMITAIASMKNLRKLHIQMNVLPDPSTMILPADFMFLVTSLPKLTVIYTSSFQANLRFALELQEYLTKTKRTMRINNVTFPCAAPARYM